MRIHATYLTMCFAFASAAFGQAPSLPAVTPTLAPDANAFVIEFKVKPGRNADFEKAMNDVLVGVRNEEPRNVYCDLLHLAHDSQTYAIVERYVDASAAKSHADSAYIKKLGEIFQNGDLLEGPPVAQELVLVRSK